MDLVAIKNALRGSGQVFQPPRTGGGIMFKGSKPQVNRTLENGEKPSECGSGSELGGNPDELRIELAGYWSHLLLRVKKQSEVADKEQSCQEARS